MSTPGNIQIRVSNYPIYFYSHHEGDQLGLIVAQALLRGKTRWNDPPYLARIIFCQLVIEQEEVKSVTGFGIDTVMGEGGVKVYVDALAETVLFLGQTYTYPEFVYRMLALEV